MTMENVEIDHIKPMHMFNLDDEVEFRECCHYSNLQPLLQEDNRFKSDKWTEDDEKQWNIRSTGAGE